MTLDDCRRFYAEEIGFAAGLTSSPLIAAFARVPREKFLGPGPWQIASADVGMGGLAGMSFTPSEDADPRHVYHNVSIALDAARNLVNGQPGRVARWIHELDLKAGGRVFHLGCGTGYYTAIMAEVVGGDGDVLAVEVDPGLAARAKENLACYPNVRVEAGDGATFDPGDRDAMLITAGVTHPHLLWVDRLREGGRLVLPLTVALNTTLGKGVVAKVIREHGRFAARFITFIVIYSCTSARDPQLEPLQKKALATGALLKLKSVRRDPHEQGESCLVHSSDTCLSSADPTAP